jgi:hypothetical protein
MPETAHKNFFLTRKALALLPLLLMGAGVWYYIQGRIPGHNRAVPASGGTVLFGTAVEKEAPSSPPAADDVTGQGAAAARIPDAYDPRAGLEIQGPPEFKSQVLHALNLIWMADRETFLFMRRNISIVRNETQTGFYMENGRSVAAISKDHAFRSLTWCAGIMAHQSWHAAYTLNKAKKKTRTVPPQPGDKSGLRVEANPMRFDYKGMDAILYVEDRASSFQLDVLKKIGAPARETGPIFRRSPRDFHLAHDGNYAINP